MKILMNRAAFERALANAGRPMSDIQRRAMFARLRERGGAGAAAAARTRNAEFYITAEQARDFARRAQSAALGPRVVDTDVSPATRDVGPIPARTGPAPQARNPAVPPPSTSGIIAPNQDISKMSDPLYTIASATAAISGIRYDPSNPTPRDDRPPLKIGGKVIPSEVLKKMPFDQYLKLLERSKVSSRGNLENFPKKGISRPVPVKR